MRHNLKMIKNKAWNRDTDFMWSSCF